MRQTLSTLPNSPYQNIQECIQNRQTTNTIDNRNEGQDLTSVCKFQQMHAQRRPGLPLSDMQALKAPLNIQFQPPLTP